jgi:hypothetical protein
MRNYFPLGFTGPRENPFVNDSYVTMLIHADGPQGGKQVLDYSPANNGFMTLSSGADTSAGGRFGPTSLRFDGANGFAYYPNSGTNFNFGTGDFTIDWWEFRVDAVDGKPSFVLDAHVMTYQPLLVGYAASGSRFVYGSTDQVNWDVINGLYMGTCTINVWTHLALVRKGNTFYAFKDGVLQGTQTSALAIPGITAGPLLGLWQLTGGTNYFMWGHIDEFRVSKGIARWTANFTPKTDGPYTPDFSGPAATAFAVASTVSTVRAGTGSAITVQAQASGANTANYTGTVRFTSTDASATLPGDSTVPFGSATFGVTFRTVGSHTVTVTDTVTGSIVGTSGAVSVTPAITAGSATFAASQWWTVPPNFNPANNTIEIYGAGAGGASSANDYSNTSSGGGGGGYCRYHNWGIVAGQAFYMNVSGGGPSDNWAGRTGIHDGTTWYLYAESGAPGAHNPNGLALGGVGGSGAGGHANYTGGTGGPGIGPGQTFEGGYGGGGAGYNGHGSGQSPGGGYANYGGNPSAGAGYAYGGGGAGAHYLGGGAGGAGAQGLIVITWAAATVEDELVELMPLKGLEPYVGENVNVV